MVEENNNLIILTNILQSNIIKRPSKHIKSPYIADISLLNNNEEDIKQEEYLCHMPSLGCCGLADNGAIILVSDLRNNNKIKSDFRAEASLYECKERNQSVIIGINPKIGENIVEECLKKNLIKDLYMKKYKRERTIGNSRFDFIGKTEDDKLFIMEVKTAPLANYVDIEKKELKKKIKNGEIVLSKYKFNEKISYFPDGYRKKKGDVVSPRALKHIEELEKIKIQYGNKIRCILIYVILRDDCNRFTTSITDPIYKKAVKKAFDIGVEIKTVQVKWNYNSEGRVLNCDFVRNDLPIDL